MVVRPQCGSLLPYHTLPGPHVLFSAKGSKKTCLFLPAFYHSFLVTYIFIHMGRASPSVIHSIAQLGAIAGRCIFCNADLSKLGRNDQWAADIAWRVGQSAG